MEDAASLQLEAFQFEYFKTVIARILPLVGPSHRSEVLAFSFGFGSYAALKSALKQAATGVVSVRFDIACFVSRAVTLARMEEQSAAQAGDLFAQVYNARAHIVQINEFGAAAVLHLAKTAKLSSRQTMFLVNLLLASEVRTTAMNEVSLCDCGLSKGDLRSGELLAELERPMLVEEGRNAFKRSAEPASRWGLIGAFMTGQLREIPDVPPILTILQFDQSASRFLYIVDAGVLKFLRARQRVHDVPGSAKEISSADKQAMEHVRASLKHLSDELSKPAANEG